MPLWNSELGAHGERRWPKSEFTGPRTGHRDGSEARTRLARPRKRSRVRMDSPSSRTMPSRRSTSSLTGPRSGSAAVFPPMPVPRLTGAASGPKGSQILACRSRQLSISPRISRSRDWEASSSPCWMCRRSLSAAKVPRWWRSET